MFLGTREDRLAFLWEVYELTRWQPPGPSLASLGDTWAVFTVIAFSVAITEVLELGANQERKACSLQFGRLKDQDGATPCVHSLLKTLWLCHLGTWYHSEST